MVDRVIRRYNSLLYADDETYNEALNAGQARRRAGNPGRQGVGAHREQTVDPNMLPDYTQMPRANGSRSRSAEKDESDWLVRPDMTHPNYVPARPSERTTRQNPRRLASGGLALAAPKLTKPSAKVAKKPVKAPTIKAAKPGSKARPKGSAKKKFPSF